MKKAIWIIIAIVIVAAGIVFAVKKGKQPASPVSSQGSQDQQATSTPDALAGWNSYTSPAKYGFSIKYPAEFGFSTDYNQVSALGYIPVCDQSMAACVFLKKDAYAGTNFDAAGVSVNIDKALNTQAKCYNFGVATNEAQNPVSDVIINGVTFKSATGGQGAAGHFVKTQVYRTFRNNLCYEIAQRVSSSNIANYPAGTVKEFNQDEVWQKLQGVIGTFKLTGSGSDYKTYNSAFYGVSLQFPDTWLLKDTGSQQEADFIFINQKFLNPVESDELIISSNSKGNSNNRTVEATRFADDSIRDSFIHFKSGDKDVYAECTYEASGQPALNICNQIISGFLGGKNTSTSTEPTQAQDSSHLQFELGKSVTLKKGQTAYLSGSDAALVLTDLIYSPCPQGAQCIWSGMDVKYQLTTGGKTYDKAALTNPQSGAPYQVSVKDTDYKTYATFVVTANTASAITVTGTTICLPHKNTGPDQPQTLECAIGVKEDNTGKYYGLKDSPQPMYDVNVHVKVTGTLVDASGSNYDAVGDIEVSTIQKLAK